MDIQDEGTCDTADFREIAAVDAYSHFIQWQPAVSRFFKMTRYGNILADYEVNELVKKRL
jgi:hypothetical protein